MKDIDDSIGTRDLFNTEGLEGYPNAKGKRRKSNDCIINIQVAASKEGFYNSMPYSTGHFTKRPKTGYTCSRLKDSLKRINSEAFRIAHFKIASGKHYLESLMASLFSD